jgi:cob(I)alamin adenosyltransferase
MNGRQPETRLTPVRVLQKLQARVLKRIDALTRVRLAGFEPAIAELEVMLDLLRRAERYLRGQ